MNNKRKDHLMHPDTVNRIVGKVSSIKSKHKAENNDSKKLVHSMVEGLVGHPVNFDDHKEMINKVRAKVEEVKSGKVPLSKYIHADVIDTYKNALREAGVFAK